MLLLRLARTMALCATLVVSAWHAVERSLLAVAVDARLAAGPRAVVVAFVAGVVLAWLAALARPGRWETLRLHRLAWAALVACLCVDGATQVAPHTSIRVLREEVPPLLAWLYPAVSGLVPLWLARSGRALATAEQVLLLALGLTALSGAPFLMTGATALGLASLALLEQLAEDDGRLPASPLLRVAAAVAGLLVLSAWLSPNPVTTEPASAWVLAASFLGLAVAARPRDAAAWRRVLATTVVAAVVVAACGAVVTACLAADAGLAPALHTRLFLFRQHPNFLAPFFAFAATVALGLALSAPRGRALAALSALLLAAATVMTDSRAGLGELAFGAAGVAVGPPLLARLCAMSARAWWLGGAAAALLVVGLVLALRAGETGGWPDRVTRLRASLSYRVEAWDNSAQLIAQRPWLGLGPQNFVSVRRFQPGSRFFNELQSPHPHDVPLYVAQAAGLPALLAFGAWTILLLVALARRSESGGPLEARLGAAVLAATLGLLFADLFDVGLALETVVPAPLFLLTGLCAADGRRRSGPVKATGGLLLAAPVLAALLPLGLCARVAEGKLDRAKRLWVGAASAETPEAAEARVLAREAIGLDPNLREAYELLSRWTERAPGGAAAARGVLLELLARAPGDGRTESLLGHLAQRLGQHAEAADALQRALADSHGSVFQSRDRTAAVVSLAALGRRTEALELLVETVRLDVGAIHLLPWRLGPTGEQELYIAPGQDAAGAPLPQPPITMAEAALVLQERQLADRAAGRPVGRDFWMATYHAWRKSGHLQDAVAMLDDLEANAPEVDRPTIASERAQLALEAGDLPAALAHFEEAQRLSGRAWFAAQAEGVRRRIAGEPEEPQPGLQAVGEILDQPQAYLEDLRRRAQAAQDAGRPGEAGNLWRRTLLFEDDVFERMRVSARAGRLLVRAGEWGEARAVLEDGLQAACAREFPADSLLTEELDTLPTRMACDLHDAWTGLDLDHAARTAAADALLPDDARGAAPGLARLALLAEESDAEALLVEADRQLREAPSLTAAWSRIDALEAEGRLDEAAAEARATCARVAGTPGLDGFGAAQAVALVTLLRGRFAEAANLFARVGADAESAHEAAHAAGWEARALLLAGGPDARERARAALERGVAAWPGCGLLARRLAALR